MRSKLYPLTLIFAVLLMGCPVEQPDAPMHMLRLFAQDNEGHFVVQNGAKIDVNLSGNPTTGYAWRPIAESILPNVTFEDVQFVPAASEVAGSGGHYWFQFDADQCGQGRVELGLFAPGSDTPEETYAVDLCIVGRSDGYVVVDAWENDNGEMRVIPVGGHVIIRLQENPSTGYDWQLTNNGDPVLAVNEGRSGFEPESEALGSPGFEAYAFDAVAAGTAEIEIGLFPPEGNEPEETYTLTVIVG